MSGSGRGSPEKDPPCGHLAGGLPVSRLLVDGRFYGR